MSQTAPKCGLQKFRNAAPFATASAFDALHIEVKYQGDRFANERQAEACSARADHWSSPGKTPDSMFLHQESDTIAFCSSKRL